ncbi:hypothetical protein H0H87_008509 [Tephrocybe sp. NHM501043]|nr:hypothetical protein H0H87_008509 [Tephrocybe sp. NHM501043]
MKAIQVFVLIAFKIFTSPFSPELALSVRSLSSSLLAFPASLNFATLDSLIVQVPSVTASLVHAPKSQRYISSLVQVQLCAVPIIPPPRQPTCLNRHVHPKFEVPGPRSLNISLPPFPPKAQLPVSRLGDAPKPESSLILSMAVFFVVGLAIWNFNRLNGRHRPYVSTEQKSSFGFNANTIPPHSGLSECKDRLVQPRVFIKALPALPALAISASDKITFSPPDIIFASGLVLVFTPASVQTTATASSPVLQAATPSTEPAQLDILESTDVEKIVLPSSSRPSTPPPLPAPRVTTQAEDYLAFETREVSNVAAPVLLLPPVLAPTPVRKEMSPLVDSNWTPDTNLLASVSPTLCALPVEPTVEDTTVNTDDSLAASSHLIEDELELRGTASSQWASSSAPPQEIISRSMEQELKEWGPATEKYGSTPMKKKRVRTGGPKHLRVARQAKDADSEPTALVESAPGSALEVLLPSGEKQNLDRSDALITPSDREADPKALVEPAPGPVLEALPPTGDRANPNRDNAPITPSDKEAEPTALVEPAPGPLLEASPPCPEKANPDRDRPATPSDSGASSSHKLAPTTLPTPPPSEKKAKTIGKDTVRERQDNSVAASMWAPKSDTSSPTRRPPTQATLQPTPPSSATKTKASKEDSTCENKENSVAASMWAPRPGTSSSARPPKTQAILTPPPSAKKAKVPQEHSACEHRVNSVSDSMWAPNASNTRNGRFRRRR